MNNLRKRKWVYKVAFKATIEMNEVLKSNGFQYRKMNEGWYFVVVNGRNYKIVSSLLNTVEDVSLMVTLTSDQYMGGVILPEWLFKLKQKLECKIEISYVII